jgi:hypothetical protein
MTYLLIHFLHVVGALGIAAAYAVETAGLVGLRQATVGEEARVWFRTRRWVLMVGPPSIGLVLATGLYTIFVRWGWTGWIDVSLASLLTLAVIGGVLTGIPTVRIRVGIESTVGPLPEELRRRIASPLLTISLTTRIAITLSIVYLMVRKPEPLPSVVVVCVAAAIGVIAGWAFAVRSPRESRAG